MVAITGNPSPSEALISRTPSTGNPGAGFSVSGTASHPDLPVADGFTPAQTPGDALGSHPSDAKKPLVNPAKPTDRRFVPLNDPTSRHTFCMVMTDSETGVEIRTIPDTAFKAYASVQALFSGSKD